MATTPPLGSTSLRVLGIDVGIRALGVCIVQAAPVPPTDSIVHSKDCLFSWLTHSAYWTIEYWELINVLSEGGSVAKNATRVGDDTLLQMVRGCLQQRITNGQIPLHTCTHVVVELQHRVNHQMESLGMAIAGYLSGMRDGNRWTEPQSIRMQSGLVKRKLFECTEAANDPLYPPIAPAPNPRLMNKHRALACVDYILTKVTVQERCLTAYKNAKVTRDQVRTKKGVKITSRITEEKRDDMADALLHALAKLWTLCQPVTRKRARTQRHDIVEQEEDGEDTKKETRG